MPKNASSFCLVDQCGRGDVVGDVESLAEAEILVTDEAHGRGSRGGCCAFERPKAKSSGVEAESSRRGKI